MHTPHSSTLLPAQVRDSEGPPRAMGSRELQSPATNADEEELNFADGYVRAVLSHTLCMVESNPSNAHALSKNNLPKGGRDGHRQSSPLVRKPQ